MKKQDIIIKLREYNQDCDIEIHDSYSYKELLSMLNILQRDSVYKLVKLGYTWAVIK